MLLPPKYTPRAGFLFCEVYMDERKIYLICALACFIMAGAWVYAAITRAIYNPDSKIVILCSAIAVLFVIVAVTFILMRNYKE